MIQPVLDHSIQGVVHGIEAIKLDDDNHTDLVFIEKGKGNAFFSLGHSGFADLEPVINSKLNLSISSPSSLAVYNFLNKNKKLESLVLLGSTSANSSVPKVFQFGPASRTDESSSWEFVKHAILSLPNNSIDGNLYSLEVADLDRAYNTYQFTIEDTLNFEEFDRTRIQSNGRLFFDSSSVPDFENPLPGSENFYRLYVNYFKNGSDPSVIHLKNCFKLK